MSRSLIFVFYFQVKDSKTRVSEKAQLFQDSSPSRLDVGPQVKDSKTRVSEKAQLFQDSSPSRLDVGPQLSIVDYSDSDDGDSDDGNMDAKNDTSDTLHNSDIGMQSKTYAVGQTGDDVPKLRRTRSIQMKKKVPSFSDALYDSSDDSMEVPSASNEMESHWLRGSSFSSFVGLDEASEGSEEEYVPDTSGESTDSEASLKISQEKKISPWKKRMSTTKKRSKFGCRVQHKYSHGTSLEECDSSSTTSEYEKLDLKDRSGYLAPVSESCYRSTAQNRSMCCSQGESGQSRSSESHDARATTSKDEGTSLEEELVFVSPVTKKEDGSRKYNKKHHCVYCGGLVQKMSRHLLRKHKDKVEVAKASSLPKNSKQRRLQFDYIRNKGNFEHNSEVLQKKQGKLIPWKQPNAQMDGQIFKHCVYCFGLFNRKQMWRHFQSCKFKPQDELSKGGKTKVQALCAFAEAVPLGFSDAYWRFLSNLIQDKITLAIKQDHCILDYGYRLFKKNEKLVNQHQYIRQKLRELGRLLLEAKAVSPVNSVKDLIKPEKYSQVISATKRLAGFNDENGKYQKPSLARKVGHNIHSLAMFVKTEGLKMKDKQTVQDAEEFIQLYQESWRYDIASQALTQIEQKKWNSPLLLPFTHDVQILHSHLTDKQQKHLNALKEKPSHSTWKDLAKVTLTQVILFNRRRAGEVSRMPLSVYLSKDASETHEDVNLALTALEQKLCSYFVRITIVGKRGRKVPVLLSPTMKESLDALSENREECGVLKENQYLFALPHSIHYLRGSDCIRQFVSECNDLKNPAALTSTKLRKHIATLSTVLNLKTTELDQLADFLGHNIAVHRKHYRLPEGTLQLAKVSKVLLALEQGRLGEYKGKSLDEIHLDVNETVDMDGISQEEEEQTPEDVEGTSLSVTPSGPESESTKKALLMPEDNQPTSCVPTSSGQCKEKLPKKRALLMPEDNQPTSCVPTSSGQCKEKLPKKRGKEMAAKRSWTSEECNAVNRHLRKCIMTNQVPGKAECERCIAAEPEALGTRDWRAVKYYVKNRITCMRRKNE
ncbi:uncharacterized protein [Nothobranchius furzeri]|uniref:uncharacterized protein n=1 Tax=Nothobranchius furzeri TaxID=105023 RepID=UPI003904BF6C